MKYKGTLKENSDLHLNQSNTKELKMTSVLKGKYKSVTPALKSMNTSTASSISTVISSNSHTDAIKTKDNYQTIKRHYLKEFTTNSMNKTNPSIIKPCQNKTSVQSSVLNTSNMHKNAKNVKLYTPVSFKALNINSVNKLLLKETKHRIYLEKTYKEFTNFAIHKKRIILQKVKLHNKPGDSANSKVNTLNKQPGKSTPFISPIKDMSTDMSVVSEDTEHPIIMNRSKDTALDLCNDEIIDAAVPNQISSTEYAHSNVKQLYLKIKQYINHIYNKIKEIIIRCKISMNYTKQCNHLANIQHRLKNFKMKIFKKHNTFIDECELLDFHADADLKYIDEIGKPYSLNIFV